MKHNFRQTLQDWNLRRKLRHAFSPTQKTVIKARIVFLKEATIAGVLHKSYVLHWGNLVIAGIVAVIAVNSGAIIYADTKDVPINHVLYSYKRIGEQVQLTMATPEREAELEAHYVDRRTRELVQIKSKNSKNKVVLPDPTNTTLTATSTASTTTSIDDITTTASTTITTDSTQPTETQAEQELEADLRQDIQKHIISVEEKLKNMSEDKIWQRKKVICQELRGLKQDAGIIFESPTTTADLKSRISIICDTTATSTVPTTPNSTSQDTGSSTASTTNTSSSSQVASPILAGTSTQATSTINTERDILELVKPKVDL